MSKTAWVVLVLGILLLAGGTTVLLLPRRVQAEGQIPTPLSSVNCDTQETSFGDLASDAIREAAGADIALVAAISFKSGSLGPGPLTATRVESLLANPAEVWAVSKLKSSQVREALEHAVRSAPLPNSAFLQVSGLSFSYSAGAPRGERLKSVRVGFNDLDDAATYTVAMPLSLAKGGSGYFKIFTKEAIQRQGETSLSASIVAYAEKRGSVPPYSGFGRITALP